MRVEQRLSLDVRPACFAPASRREQQLDLGSFVLQSLQARLQDGLQLLLTVECSPVIADVLAEERELALRQLEHLQTTLQGFANRARARRDQPLHEDHQEADCASLFLDGLVVAVAHVLGHRSVQRALLAPAAPHATATSCVRRGLNSGFPSASIARRFSVLITKGATASGSLSRRRER